MSQMIYKHGGDTLVWGMKAKVKVVTADELETHLADGWLDHPSKLLETGAEPRKRGRKPKGESDE